MASGDDKRVMRLEQLLRDAIAAMSARTTAMAEANASAQLLQSTLGKQLEQRFVGLGKEMTETRDQGLETRRLLREDMIAVHTKIDTHFDFLNKEGSEYARMLAKDVKSHEKKLEAMRKEPAKRRLAFAQVMSALYALAAFLAITKDWLIGLIWGAKRMGE